jgi:hypothetical protein
LRDWLTTEVMEGISDIDQVKMRLRRDRDEVGLLWVPLDGMQRIEVGGGQYAKYNLTSEMHKYR